MFCRKSLLDSICFFLPVQRGKIYTNPPLRAPHPHPPPPLHARSSSSSSSTLLFSIDVLIAIDIPHICLLLLPPPPGQELPPSLSPPLNIFVHRTPTRGPSISRPHVFSPLSHRLSVIFFFRPCFFLSGYLTTIIFIRSPTFFPF